MTGIVRELQKEAVDKSARTSDLLRKALLVARKLNVHDIEEWILNELNGYAAGAKLPDYRLLKGEMKGRNHYTGQWMPVVFSPSEQDIQDAITRQHLHQSISEVESMISEKGRREFAMSYSPKLTAKLMEAGSMDSPPVLIVQEPGLRHILDAVRTTVLDWSLKLEQKGVLGEDLSFSEADRRAASHVVFNIQSMSHSQIQSETVGSQQTLVNPSLDPAQLLKFVTKARAALPSLGLKAAVRDELRGELDTIEAQSKSPKPKSTILQESAHSVRTILEGATGNAVAEGLLAALRLLLGG